MGNDFGLSENAVKQFNDLYCLKDESISDAFNRVASDLSDNDEDKSDIVRLLEEGIWRPNSPTWLNAGTDHKIFSACFVVGLSDSMDSIYDIANVARKIFQYGSGIGIPIGNLRESEAFIYEGNKDKVPEGKSSGPITFMKLYDSVGETTKSGGRVRRAAILCSLPVWHPDIRKFITCKQDDGRLASMNISVALTCSFMQALEDGVSYPIVSPNGGEVMQEDANEIWDLISEMAHKTADPGVIFIDTVNKYNPLVKKFLIEVSNPCGEQFLMPFGNCWLSHINVAKFVKDIGDYDWDGLYETAFNVTKYMDYTIDIMSYPDVRFENNSKKYRQIGMGIMGLADALYKLNYRYDGPDGRKFASKVMRIMTSASVHRSALLAKENGPFHDYGIFKDDMERIIAEHIGLEDSDVTNSTQAIFDLVKEFGVRNCQFTTAAPTGTTALSCDASYGIEPIFGLVFQKNYIDDTIGVIANPVFEQRFKNEEWYTDNLPDRIFKNGGTLKGLHGIPKEVREVFVTAHDIKYKDRIDMQAELQKYCSNAISSTVNLPRETTVEEISDIYKYAYEKGLKGITIYRDGSKKNQPVSFTSEKKFDRIKPFKRPSKLTANIYALETGNGKMYVTVSDYQGKPLEVFINLGKSGQAFNTFAESVGRLISIALQKGVSVEDISKTLIGINSDRATWFRFEETDKKPVQILSIPDGVAQLLTRYYSGRSYGGELSGEICPRCGGNMMASEGCFSCPCGYSKCS